MRVVLTALISAGWREGLSVRPWVDYGRSPRRWRPHSVRSRSGWKPGLRNRSRDRTGRPESCLGMDHDDALSLVGGQIRASCGWRDPAVGASRLGMYRRFSWVALTKCRCSEIVLGEASTRYGKLLTRLTGPEKTREMAHNTGFSGMARPGSDGLGLPFGGENVGAAGSESPSVSSGQAFG